MKDNLHSVGTMLYQNREEAADRKVLLQCPTKRCVASVYPSLPELRADLEKIALAEHAKDAA